MFRPHAPGREQGRARPHAGPPGSRVPRFAAPGSRPVPPRKYRLRRARSRSPCGRRGANTEDAAGARSKDRSLLGHVKTQRIPSANRPSEPVLHASPLFPLSFLSFLGYRTFSEIAPPRIGGSESVTRNGLPRKASRERHDFSDSGHYPTCRKAPPFTAGI